MQKQQSILAISEIEGIYQQARSYVESELQVDLSSIQLQLISNREINTQAHRYTKDLNKSIFSNKKYAAYRSKASFNIDAADLYGLYSSFENKVYVNLPVFSKFIALEQIDPNITRQAMLALLVHELIHAADDIRYEYTSTRSSNYRQVKVKSAIYEGHAQYIGREICRVRGCAAGMLAIDGNEPELLSDSDAYLEYGSSDQQDTITRFSYEEGEYFFDSLSQRPESHALFQQVLEQPPADPLQIIDPASYPNRQREQRNQLLSAQLHPLNLGSNWISVETSTVNGIASRHYPRLRDKQILALTKGIRSMTAFYWFKQTTEQDQSVLVRAYEAVNLEVASKFQQERKKIAERDLLNLGISSEFIKQTLLIPVPNAKNLQNPNENIEVNLLSSAADSEPDTAPIQLVELLARSNQYLMEISGINLDDSQRKELVSYMATQLNNMTKLPASAKHND